MLSRWHRKKILITVRTYPTPARKTVEQSCTAGITEAGEWIRLFPVPWRLLDEDKRFRKYQWIEVDIRKAPSDRRPESFNPNLDSLHVLTEPLPTTSDWSERKRLILPLDSHCLCCLHRSWQEQKAPTLGVFQPRAIQSLIIERDSETWTPQELSKLRQTTMFDNTPAKELEKIPYRFKYCFTCWDATCRGHELSCTDWEMAQSYRRWRAQYGAEWEQKFRQRYEVEMVEKYDTHFFVGNMHQYPTSWLVVGLFYPPRNIQPSLGL